jgi:hypothetical protein
MQASNYDTDFYAWSAEQADLLKERKFEMIDWENVIEEIESLARRDKRSVKSFLENIFMHSLKLKFQPEKQIDSHSWQNSIRTSFRQLHIILDDSPSLKAQLEEFITECYSRAVKEASKETNININVFPKECPWTKEQILDGECPYEC